MNGFVMDFKSKNLHENQKTHYFSHISSFVTNLVDLKN